MSPERLEGEPYTLKVEGKSVMFCFAPPAFEIFILVAFLALVFIYYGYMIGSHICSPYAAH